MNNNLMMIINNSQKYNRVILVSVMPVNESRMKKKGYDTNITNNAKIEEFNSKIRQVAESSRATYCDIYSIMKDNMDKYELDSGGLHFTAKGYKEIYKLIGETCF